MDSTRGRTGSLVHLLVFGGLAGCLGGQRSGGGGDEIGLSAAVVPTSAVVDGYFAGQVQPNLDFCRTCHVPGGIADTPGSGPSTRGDLFLLSNDKTQDYANLKASWTRLGQGVDDNPLLTRPSDVTLAHTGGQPWPKGSPAYEAMRALLGCWNDPTGCDALLQVDGGAGGVASGSPPGAPALLGSSHGRSYMDVFCEGKSDDAVLPRDPRELIRPGVNQGKAVAFNAYWQDCQGPAGPKTCGDYRSRAAAGQKLVRTDLAANVSHNLIPGALYNSMWTRWDGSNLEARPQDFDDQVLDRYGFPRAPFDNPYPLPGEDPNLKSGGSGQLPLGLRQLKTPDGKWTGTISITCDVCHSSSIKALGELGGSEFVPGMGENTGDLQLLFTDLMFPLPIGLNDSRGVTNAQGISGLMFTIVDQDSLGARFDTTLLMQLPGNTTGSGDAKSPPWWNASHRPRKFWDGGYSQNETRMDSYILEAMTAMESPLGTDKAFNKNLRDRIESESLVIQTYIESLQAPAYPWPIDTALAQQGAVLFHTRDLWAHGANANIPRPPTNGSCAGCHGAYSPRFVEDPTFLDDPSLEGMAGYVVPMETIGTDPERFNGFTKPLLEMMSTNWFSYPEHSDGYVSPDDKLAPEEFADDFGIFTGVRPKGACTWEGGVKGDALGYLAPPLHGIWATGPYLHNASVPDIWGVLSPDSRPEVWRRKLTASAGSEHGLDTSGAAYDTEKLGWKYDTLVCGQNGVNDPYVDCEPTTGDDAVEKVAEFIRTSAGGIDSLAYQVTQPINRRNVELRKIVNTHLFAKSNRGHEFTRSLTDAERYAILEYLKTL